MKPPIFASLKCLLPLLLMAMDLEVTLAGNRLRLVKQWNQLEFAFPDEATRQRALEMGYLVEGNAVPIDVDVHYGGGGKTRIFVSMPRFDSGRPFTLGVISAQGSNSNALKPYPDYSWHDNQGSNCDGITSVFRIAIDECLRLWVLDSGKIGDTKYCDPQLLAFDLKTDTLLHRHRIPQASQRDVTLMITPIVDVKDPGGECKNTFVYMADVSSFAVLVYDLAQDRSWRVENKLFYPYPSQGTFTIAGETFDLMDGVFGLSLSPLKSYETDRVLYFHALASNTENYVRTAVMQNSSLWENGATADPALFKAFKPTRPTQATAEAVDRNGVMFYGLTSSTSIGCWNTNTKFHPANMDVVAHDPETLQFASGLKIVTNMKGEQELWVLTCRFQKLMTGTMTPAEVNFRIQAAKVSQLLEGTKCGLPNGRTRDELNLVDENQKIVGCDST